MGYRRPPLRLVFEAPEFEGLEVRARRYTIGELERIWTMPDDLPRVERDAVALEVFLAVVSSWNLEGEDGEPVPLTPQGVRSTDRGLVDTIISEVMNASTVVAPPLRRPSDGGSPSGEEWELMESLSTSTGPS